MLPVSLNSSSSFLAFASNPFTDINCVDESRRARSYHVLDGQWEKKPTEEGGETIFSVLSCTHCPPWSICKLFTTRQLTKTLTTFVISPLLKNTNMLIRRETKKESPSRN